MRITGARARRAKNHRAPGLPRVVAVLACAALVLAAGCGRKKQAKSESITDIQKRVGVPVTVTTAAARDLAAIERCSGTVEGYEQSVLSASIPATVASVGVKVGQRVRKDAELMRLSPYTPSALTIARANAESAEKSQERAKALAAQGGVPQEMLDNIETGVVAARAQLASARKTEHILAPFSGTVVEVYPTLNQVVSPGKELVKIASLGRVRVKLSVSEAVIQRFARGQTAVLRIENDSLTGTVDKVALAADESSHAFTVDAVFDNSAGTMRPGMYVSVDVVVDTRSNVLALPMETVIAEGAKKYVYVVKDDTASRKPVAVGLRGGSWLEIAEGLAAGDRVVTSGASLLSDGAKVNIVQ